MIPLILACLAVAPANPYGPLYDRMARDASAGKMITMTIYVALCDANSQGVVTGKHSHMCTGDPKKNVYWTTKGGLKGYLERQGWLPIMYQELKGGSIAARGVWQKKLTAGPELRKRGSPKQITVQIVGLAYRGPAIGQAALDFLRATASDRGVVLANTKTGPILQGGTSHIVGYMGHNYLMDVTTPKTVLAAAKSPIKKDKGVFVLACLSDEYFRPALTKAQTHILLLNTTLTYPTGWTVGGLVDAISTGDNPEQLRIKAATSFSKIQKKPLAEVLPKFSNIK